MSTYIIADMKKGTVVKEFFAENDDDAIAYLFALHNPPPKNYNLYQTTMPGAGKEIKFDMAKFVSIPDEITEDGDYVFDGSVREEN